MSDYDLGYENPPTLEEEFPEPASRPARDPREGLYNIVSILFLVASVGVIAWAVALVQNPISPLNPFPPQAGEPEPTLIAFDFAEEEAVAEEDSSTPTSAPSPTITLTHTPTTVVIVDSGTGGSPEIAGTPPATDGEETETTGTPAPEGDGGPTPELTNTRSLYPFTLQDEAVNYTQNENDDGCAWLSIAGQVFDINGDPLKSLAVVVKGENFEYIVISGANPEFGESGFEVFLNSTPIEAEWEVQLLNTTGQQLSETVIVRTLSSCERNVAVVNFIQNYDIEN